jgi:hypothetical protein
MVQTRRNMSTKDVIPVISAILCLALVPGSFVGAFFLIRKAVTGTAGRVVLTIFLGGVFLIAGVVAIVAGCASIVPMDFK